MPAATAPRRLGQAGVEVRAGARLDLRRAARVHAASLPETLGTALTDAEREDAVAVWSGRMRNEYVSARVFEALLPQLAAAGVHDARLARVARMADEERLHGELCAAVVLGLGGDPVVDVGALDDVPAHADATPVEAALRNVLSVSCLSETVAVAQISAERDAAAGGEGGDPALSSLLGRILADEVGHARFGWRLLDALAPGLDGGARERLTRYLTPCFAALLAHHRLTGADPGVVPRRAAQQVGLCDGALQHRVMRDTVAQVIVPALEAHGLGARAAWRAATGAGAAG